MYVVTLRDLDYFPSGLSWVSIVLDDPKGILQSLKGLLSVEEAPRVYKAIEERLGSEVKRENPLLGRGEYGAVFKLADGRVVKNTTDDAEVKANAILKAVRHPNIVRVDDVFLFHVYSPLVSTGGSNLTIRFIEREEVPQTIEEFKELGELLVDVGSETSDWLDQHFEMDQAVERFMEDVSDKLPLLGADERRIGKDILSGIRALKEAGIYTFDFGPKNVGLREGKAVLFDIGSAQFKEGLEAPVDLILWRTRQDAVDITASLARENALA
jgi:serine/threonine protein kinase